MTVLVGIDGSSAARRAVRWAAGEAAARHTRLDLVLADDWVGWTSRRPRAVHLRERMFERAQAYLRQAAAEAHAAAPGIDVRTELVTGRPIRLLTQKSAEAELVVLGNPGTGGLAGLLAGSVAVGVVTHAECPVVVVRDGERQRSLHDPGSSKPVNVVRPDLPRQPAPDLEATRPVVVGVDGSPDSDAAMAFAFDHAALHRRPLVAVRAGHSAVLDDGTEMLSEQLAGWLRKYPDVPVRPVVHQDRPAVVLAEHGRDAGLMVVGARGRGRTAGLLLGSTSQAVMHRADCPVVVLRGRRLP